METLLKANNRHTQCSTLESIKEIIPSMLPKQILNEMYSKAGELLQMSSSGEVQNLH